MFINSFIKKSIFMKKSRWRLRHREIIVLSILFFLQVSIVHVYGQVASKSDLSGIVVDKTGEAIPGVTVVLEGTVTGTVTDFNGEFNLSVPKGSTNLVISFIGFDNVVVPIKGKTYFNVVLEESMFGLDEVVVVGYGTQNKATVTGAISNIQTDEILQSPQANLSNALVGRVSGLIAVQGSGEPGKDQSLLRIRGVGTFGEGAGPLIMVDGIETSNYNNIDPNEIADITVLKDASATAVYGIRGANGVLLITTKRGKIGKPQFSLRSSMASSQFVNLRQSLGAYDYSRMFNEAKKYDSYVSGSPYVPQYTDEDIELYRNGTDPIFHPNSNWQDQVLKKSAFQHQHNLNVSGGTEKVKYFISLGYFSQEGLFKTENLTSDFDPQIRFERYNFRSNLDFEVTKRLDISVNISSEIEDRKGADIDTKILMDDLMRSNPVNSPGLYEGKILHLEGKSHKNPFEAMLRGGYASNFKNYLKGSVRLNYELDFLLRGLKTHVTFSYQNYYAERSKYTRYPLLTYNAIRGDEGAVVYQPQGEETPFGFNSILTDNYKNRKAYTEFGLDYEREFGSHNVTAMLLYKQSKDFNPDFAYKVPNGYQGGAGRLTYDYKRRYLLETNMGYEGTENFAPSRRFGFFPSASVGWVVSEEPFFPKSDIVTFLKIRATAGEVGNDKIDPKTRFAYQPSPYLYTGGTNWGEIGNNVSYYGGASEGKNGNPFLVWERAVKRNVGVDLNLFNNKLAVTVDWFDEKRDDILIVSLQDLPVIYGNSDNSPSLNSGKMNNGGFDGDITYRSNVGGFKYWTKFNFTYATNEIIYISEVSRDLTYQYRTGQRLDQFFGFVADGLYNSWEEVNDPNRPKVESQNNILQPGDIKYKDINGDGIIDSKDEVPLGYSDFPEVVAGWSFGFDFKNFDFSILFQGATHVSMNTSRRTNRGFFDQESGAPELLRYSWSQERYDNGDKILLPHLSVGDDVQKNNYVNSSFWIRDASYVRLKNMEIGYTFKGAVLRRIGLESCRIYANGSNLFVWDSLFPGEDPELPEPVNNLEPYPVTATTNLGVNIKF